MSGTHSQGTIYGFFGLGEEQTHKESHTYDADHPEQLVAQDTGPTPAEFLLHALAACITAGVGNIAAVRGIDLSSVESTVTGDIDLLGVLGLDDSVRNGYQGIQVKLRIEGDASGRGAPRSRGALGGPIGGVRRAHQRDPGVPRHRGTVRHGTDRCGRNDVPATPDPGGCP